MTYLKAAGGYIPMPPPLEQLQDQQSAKKNRKK